MIKRLFTFCFLEMSDLQEKVRLFEKTGYGGKESVKLNQIYCESFSPGIRYKRVGKAAIAWKKNLRQFLLTALRLTQNVLNSLLLCKRRSLVRTDGRF